MNLALAASTFPERFFATCHRGTGAKRERFRIYGQSIDEVKRLAAKGGDTRAPIYDTVLRSRVR